MEIRYLNQEEKERSRKLWEECFPEDSARFLDYYYQEKCRDNRILVLEDGRPAGWGTHEELLASCGAYQETYDSQYPGEREKRGFAAEGVTA